MLSIEKKINWFYSMSFDLYNNEDNTCSISIEYLCRQTPIDGKPYGIKYINDCKVRLNPHEFDNKNLDELEVELEYDPFDIHDFDWILYDYPLPLNIDAIKWDDSSYYIYMGQMTPKLHKWMKNVCDRYAHDKHITIYDDSNSANT